MLLQLAEDFAARGFELDLLITRVKGSHDRAVPESLVPIRLERCSAFAARVSAARAAGREWPHLVGPVLGALSASWALRYLPALAAYLRERRPDVLLAANTWPNLVALWARRLARVETRIVVSERTQLSERVQHLRRRARWRHLPLLLARFYREADEITAVSRGVARDLVAATGLPPHSVKALPNPVVSTRLHELAEAPAPHPWLGEGEPPVILGAGRLHPEKDFRNLLKAFAQVRRRRSARLIIIGEGPERARLEKLRLELGLASEVALPGHAPNPFAFMRRSAVFALSSRYEGLPGVLIQAMACGCPCVSTDCPSGPREIMEDGKLGPLVPVGKADELAKGIIRCLDDPVPRVALRNRASAYSVEAAADAYLEVLLKRDPGHAWSPEAKTWPLCSADLPATPSFAKPDWRRSSA